MNGDIKPRADGDSDLEDLTIDDLEDKEAPFEWVCLTSSTCKCTSTSCAGWSV